MCCILGAYAAKTLGERQFTSVELDTMRHRGPDGAGWFLSPSAQLGFRRLSIIDPAGGHQPLYNEDESIVLTLNGEIYNHRALRTELGERHRFRTRSDAEVVLHLYEEHGEGFIEHLQGMFGLALLDRRRNRLMLARDRAGKKPVYYSLADGVLSWSSEIRPLCRGRRPAINQVALADYLRFGYVPAPLTMLEGIHKLPAGHVLVAEPSGVPQIRPYWGLRYAADHRPAVSEAELQGWSVRLREALDAAVGSRLESDVPMGFLLSGGVDSSAVFASGASRLGEGTTAFTVSFPGEAIDESVAAGEVARRYGAQHRVARLSRGGGRSLEEVLASVEEPISTDALVPTDRVFQAVREAGITVVLAGEGSDELFAGYRKFRAAPCVAKDAAPLDRYLAEEEFVIAAAEERRSAMTAEVEERDYAELNERVAHLDPLGQMLQIENEMRLPDRINLRLDKLSMAHSIEARAPFMDHHFQSFATKLPRAGLMRRGRDKAVLRQAMQSRLPHSVLSARKAPFHAPHAWEVEGDGGEVPLPAERVAEAGLVRPEYVQRLQQEQMVDVKAGEKLYSLCVLHAWHDGFYRSL